MTRLLPLLLTLLVACGDKDDDTADATEDGACPVDVELTGPELPCDCFGTEVGGLPGDGSSCYCREDVGFDCEPFEWDSGETR